MGNRLDIGFVYDEDTDWLSEGPQDVERQYTGAGSMYDKDGTGYTYNAQELLTGVGSTTMAWDAESRRVSLNVGNDAYTFVYDPTASIPAVVQEFGPNGRSIIYAREPSGSLIARVNLGQSRVYFHYFDALGSTVLVANNLGQVTDRYAYDAWGEVDHLSGSTADNPYLYVGELGYYDHWQAPALADMLHLGVRFYEPEVGRFGQVDPIMAPRSGYAYVCSMVGSSADPSGYNPITEFLFGDGQVCVTSSCKGKKHYPAGMQNIPDLGRPDSREAMPPAPSPGKDECGKAVETEECVDSDGIFVPLNVRFDLDRVPQRPGLSTILKIYDGWKCTFSCNDRSTTNRLRLTCTSHLLMRPFRPRWLPVGR